MKDFGWTFRDESLFATASSGMGDEFQRLEFLGDAIAQAALVPWVYRWSAGSVAVMTGAWQHLLGDSNLGYLASVTGVRELLDPRARNTKERDGDAVEAIVGAAYLDGGWEAATKVCETLLGEWLTQPDGVWPETARIDTEVKEVAPGRWQCRYWVWIAGEDTPLEGGRLADSVISAELAAVTDALDSLGRKVRFVWMEASTELRARLREPASDPDNTATTVIALLATYEGVWFLPGLNLGLGGSLCGDHPPADGMMSEFEVLLGRDLVHTELERFVTRPGSELRRLSAVGDAVMKAVSGIRVYTGAPHAREGELTDLRQTMLAVMNLNRIALHSGLLSVVESATTPSMLHQLVRASLGVVAVDDGPDAAARLATEWLDRALSTQTPTDQLTVIAVESTSGITEVNVSLRTASVTSAWTLREPDVHWSVVALEGVAAAVDAIPAADEDHPVLIIAPPWLVELMNGNYRPSEAMKRRAVEKLHDRIAKRDLVVVCDSSPVTEWVMP